ncbi:hypothetical protein I6N90_14180 [Paenibacillus sp. GSMTC-2017]|uniref:DUF5984 family protein n=1 Tax=Paenibacillus sp. GSMTC-2017 TaxID=2794350 RepID=UPI0018D5D774|nr:DUF5984 family protein [Paenibacillus sp. GSMTC-2017]MBH5318949.1 hypothetical protein [Paenibacillus sp. GSMTC-2017]
MINFQLKDLLKITPWGENNDLTLHWYGLSDSYYWFVLGDYELLRYSDEFEVKYRGVTNLPYVDYQFIRLYQDIRDILQNIAIPIPADVFEFINTLEKQESFLTSLTYWLNNVWNDSDEEYDEIYEPVKLWIYNRKLIL